MRGVTYAPLLLMMLMTGLLRLGQEPLSGTRLVVATQVVATQRNYKTRLVVRAQAARIIKEILEGRFER